MVFPHLFHEGAYRFEMRFEKGRLEEFYAPTASGPALLRQRRRWLSEEPEKCLVLSPEAEPLVQEMVETLALQVEVEGDTGLRGLCLEIGSTLEPDYLLLKRIGDRPKLVCGCVCFPSSWDVREKIGLPMEQIHSVVPGLNSAIGTQIGTFLSRLKPGISWERSNWGLSRSPELNQHPAHSLPRLDERVGEEEVFFRVEHQSLAALPRSDGVLFGIRIHLWPLPVVKKAPAMRAGLLKALETMPPAMAAYKNVAAARGRLIELLRG